MTTPFSLPRRLCCRLSYPAWPLAMGLSLSLSLLPSCRKSEITTYIAPKDVPYVTPGTGPANDGHGASPPPSAPAPSAAAAPVISYTAPDHWQKVSGSPMSAGQFTCATPQGTVNVGIISLNSMQGQENLLIGMWRGSVGLSEGTEEEAAKSLSPIEIGGGPGQKFEVTGTMKGQPFRILTAFIHRDGRSWFFKIEGLPEAVETQKTAFTEFLKTVKF